MKNAAIIGGTGYGAIELIRLLHSHKHIQLKKIISNSQHGEQISSIYPHLTSFIEEPMEKLEIKSLEKEVDIVFFATPAGISKKLIPQLEQSSLQCIDLSGDLRITSQDQYLEWYGAEAAPQETIDNAVYGLPEIYKEEIKNAKIISNPGCFPTSSLLGLIPAIQHKVIENSPIIIDGKTGISGAGRTPSAMTHFSEVNDNVKAYKVGKHQHIPEIDQYLSGIANESVTSTFTPHLIPMTRGLICTMYGQLKMTISTEEIIDLYKSFYQSEPFVRIRNKGEFPATKDMNGSNYCDIGLHVDERTNQLIIISAIDNLVKGAAGQAIQNVNLMNGWDEEHGLNNVPVYP
ncbi:N-acetyl-gamma-glutamyl-phosphate reductase [Virgibacillus sp. C22-A2]|uniref:N-acetyl-gamma-glutamyl-phosphate reductase n=1 Tax=Virgibacillus tibetensis TaxID=3042313 RepID=A0ABU6KF20_9BACI|nr:N-acetyl-gamma-glutamyl-phosphate reductase [Virgibacillus sp. C22-A2]